MKIQKVTPKYYQIFNENDNTLIWYFDFKKMRFFHRGWKRCHRIKFSDNKISNKEIYSNILLDFSLDKKVTDSVYNRIIIEMSKVYLENIQEYKNNKIDRKVQKQILKMGY